MCIELYYTLIELCSVIIIEEGLVFWNLLKYNKI